MIRLVDFRCSKCGRTYEDCVQSDNQVSTHCGKPAVKVWLRAPGLGGDVRPHYSHALGRKVKSYAEEEKALAKTGSWIASKTEANRLYDTDHFTSDVTIKKDKERIRKHVEKAASKAVADGKIRFHD